VIATSCEGCCFLIQDEQGKGCILHQACALREGKVIAPGYCRLCRSRRWSNKNSSSTTELSDLHQLVIKENAVNMDLLVFFDEANNTIEDLERTLQSDWYVKYTKKVIIVDVTGFGNRKNIALDYLRHLEAKRYTERSVPVIVDSSALHESQDDREATILRISKQVSARFFFAIPAGYHTSSFDDFASIVQRMPTRVIHWSLPVNVGNTVIVPNSQHKLQHGLFITDPYKSLMRLPEKESFTERLRFEEVETEMGLSWLCSHC